ncbi:MAG TPA: hypothetical protein VHV30_16865 [Polyangiaceae bacterium]|nr:hypothetical protein [Polyangiaceae bacterium]
MIARGFGPALAFVVAIGVAAIACSAVSGDARVGIEAPNGSEDQFGIVGDYLDHRCGSLDCHGQAGRNLRVWGCEGMRLDPKALPICSVPLGGASTTPDEHQATYRSLVGLEPTVMSQVVADHGQHPELLTFVRKARGLEAHKGGVLITPGDDQDECICSWLAGQTDTIACANALGYPMFPQDASTE